MYGIYIELSYGRWFTGFPFKDGRRMPEQEDVFRQCNESIWLVPGTSDVRDK